MSEHAPVKHSVESRDLVHSHRRHLQEFRNVVHHANTGPAFILSLSEIEKGNNSSLFVLWGITLDNFFCTLHVGTIEFECNLDGDEEVFRFGICRLGDLWVIVWCVPVLWTE